MLNTQQLNPGPWAQDTQAQVTPNLGLIRKLLNLHPLPGCPCLGLLFLLGGSRTHQSISEPQGLKEPLKKDPGSELPSNA